MFEKINRVVYSATAATHLQSVRDIIRFKQAFFIKHVHLKQQIDAQAEFNIFKNCKLSYPQYR